MSEWISPLEDSPPIEKGRNSVSVDILIKLSNEEIVMGFCDVLEDEYYRVNGRKISYDKIVGWQII